MRVTTDALIIRENNNIGESDRFVTALTRECGVVRASARGAQRIKSRHGPATQLLTHSRLTLYRGREKYIIDESEPLHVFFELRADVERLAAAQYLCELTDLLAPREEPAEDWLRLDLNALHLLGDGKYPIDQIKAVTELRMLALAGYMPDLTGCGGCGAGGGKPMYLSLTAGTLRCSDCTPLPGSAPLSGTVLAAMRHVLNVPLEKAFFFNIPDAERRSLAAVCEQFLLAQLGRGFHTLDFYHSLQTPLSPKSNSDPSL
ncbi:MAG: DNA repair protein RecO [Acutalibacteraceae bacterium]|jgi:DNA repair protein RecO (recombination protein O)